MFVPASIAELWTIVAPGADPTCFSQRHCELLAAHSAFYDALELAIPVLAMILLMSVFLVAAAHRLKVQQRGVVPAETRIAKIAIRDCPGSTSS